MSELEQLRRRIEVLESREEVREAMCRYWRVLDYKIWEQLEDCFTEDADADWGTGSWRAVGRAQIYAFLHGNEGDSGMRLSHFGHNPEVVMDAADPASANAIFKLEDWVTLNGVTIMKGFGQYRMQFRRGEDGVWRISRLRLLHDYREEFPRYIDGVRVATTPALDQG
jgi:hypothetical protein